MTLEEIKELANASVSEREWLDITQCKYVRSISIINKENDTVDYKLELIDSTSIIIHVKMV